VIIGEALYDRDFIAQHTVGFEALAAHVTDHSPSRAAEITGIPAAQIVALARRYATTRPAMIVLGGSSMHKGANGWQGGRAIACLPALTGHLGIPGGGLGPRHGSSSHGQALASILPATERPPGTYIPNQMSRMTEALIDGRVRAMLLFGTNMLSSFADADRLAAGLARTHLIVSHDLFMHDTARRFADVILPGTAWLEQLGCKMTTTHFKTLRRVSKAHAR
jgi:anaerobic selenocysteine-containing dehydrogenase